MANTKVMTGDPIKGETSTYKKGMLDRHLDIRDRLSELVGKGNAMRPDDRTAIYADLSDMVGKDKALKIINHAAVFNQRPDIQKLGMEDRLKAFYDIGSNDPDVNAVILKSKSLGYGVLPGFRNSTSQLNQELAGRIRTTANAQIDPSAARQIMLKIKK